MANLEQGDVSVDFVAKKLAMSRRSLQRRRSEAGITFKRLLLDDSRRALCFRYLESRDASVEEIAFLAGFADPSSLFRAFRRWTRTTFTEWCGRR